MTPTTTTHGRLLVVDDEPDICEFLAEDFGHQGLDVRTACSVDQAMGIFASWQPHVIVSDIRMPVLSGLDLLRMVNRSPKPVPVLFMSGFTDVSTQQIYAMGACGLFHKPLNLDALGKQIALARRISSIDFGSRSSNRAPAALPVTLKLKGQSPTYKKGPSLLGTIKNLSRTGFYVVLKEGLLPNVGDEIEFVFDVGHPDEAPVSGRGICRWTHGAPRLQSPVCPSSALGPDNPAPPIGLGVEFKNLAGDSYEPLLNHTTSLGSFWAPGRSLEQGGFEAS